MQESSKVSLQSHSVVLTEMNCTSYELKEVESWSKFLTNPLILLHIYFLCYLLVMNLIEHKLTRIIKYFSLV